MTHTAYPPPAAFHGRSFSASNARVRPSIFENPTLYICVYFCIHLYPFVKIPLVASAVLVLAFLATALKQPDMQRLFFRPVVFWFALGYTVFVLLMYAQVSHGLYQTNMIFAYRLLRYIPEFLMAIYLASRRHDLFYFALAVLSVSAFTGLLSLVFNVSYYGETGGIALRDRHQIVHRHGGEADTAMDAMAIGGVNAAAARAYYFLFCLGAFLAVARLVKLSAIPIAVVLLGAVLAGSALSGLTIPFMLIAIGIAAYGILRINKPSNLVLSFLMVLVFSTGVYLSYHFNLTVFTNYFDKAWDLVLRLSGSAATGHIDEVDRYRLFMASWHSFLSNPLIGIGGRVFIVGAGGAGIGGHSGLADFLGQYGLLGSLGVVGLFGATVYYMNHLRKKSFSLFSLLFVFFSVYFVHSFVNPTFGVHELNRVLFMMLGLMFGFYYAKRPFDALLPPRWAARQEFLRRRPPPMHVGRRIGG